MFVQVLVALSAALISIGAAAQESSVDPGSCFGKADPYQTLADLERFIHPERFLDPVQNPFQYACNGQIRKDGIPSGLDVRYVRNDRDTEHMSRFLKSVGRKIQKYLDLNRRTNTELINCLAEINGSPCPDKQNMVAELQWRTRSAREHMAIVQGLDGTLGQYGFSASHDAPLLQKPVPWGRYTKSELQSAQKYVSDMKKRLKDITAPGTPHFDKFNGSYLKSIKADTDVEIRDESQKRDIASRLYRLSLETLRESHLKEYEEIMGRVILLGYISSDTPTQSEALSALQRLEENRKNEEELIRKTLADLGERSDIAGAASVLLRYSAIVEEVLVTEPEFCQVAARAAKIRTNRDRNTMIGLILPILAASIAAPPAAAGTLFSLEGVLTGYFIGDAALAFRAARQSRYAGPIDDDALISREDEEAARAQYVLEAAMAPLTLVGAPIRKARGLVIKKNPAFVPSSRKKATQ